jgi:hypothetical protein
MRSGEILAALLLLAFAVLVTAHVAIVAGLARRAPRWRAAVALVVPPLAPYWGWTRLRRWSLTWVVAVAVYAVVRVWAAK